MILVKLGGSVITDKSQYQVVRLDVLRRLCGEMAGAEDIVVVHGAGSFGHIMAHEHRLSEGHRDASQIAAYAAVSRDVRELNLMVLDAMIEAGMRPVSLPPSACITLKDGKLEDFDAGLLHGYLELGMVPVLFGDVALDSVRGFAICSGDQAMEHLAKELSPRRSIFVSDVDGIMDRDPGEPGAELLAAITPDDLDSMTFHARVKDVTGGIRRKVESMLSMCSPGMDCIIINGNAPGLLADAIAGKEVRGTRVKVD